MIRSWFHSDVTPALRYSSASFSTVFHVVVIAAWVIATLPPEGLATKAFENHAIPVYHPPPDRVPTQAGSQETVRFIKFPTLGEGLGDGSHGFGNAKPTPVVKDTATARGKDSVTAPEAPPTKGQDSVYSVLDVDVAVVRSASSAAPAYPLKLLEKHVTGFVNAQYIVDTTGFADTTSFVVLQSTNPEFTVAVRDVLPYMRFEPARIGSAKVRQLVQQQFTFKITEPVDAAKLSAPRKP
jgi:protein TonB